jgi:hypothetical protein
LATGFFAAFGADFFAAFFAAGFLEVFFAAMDRGSWEIGIAEDSQPWRELDSS